MKHRKTPLVLRIAVLALVGIFTTAQVGLGASVTDYLRQGRGPEEEKPTNWAEGFKSEQGRATAHRRVFNPQANIAFQTGRGVNLLGHQAQTDLNAAAQRYVEFNPGTEVSEAEQALNEGQALLKEALTDEWVEQLASEILTLTPREKGKALHGAIEKASAEPEATRLSSLRRVLLEETRYSTLLVGSRFMDPYLFSAGDIVSAEHRAILANFGAYQYDGSEDIEGGPRSFYIPLARLRAYNEVAEAVGIEASELIRQLIGAEFKRFIAGEGIVKNEDFPELVQANDLIRLKHASEELKIGRSTTERGTLQVDTDKVSIEILTAEGDFGEQVPTLIIGKSKTFSYTDPKTGITHDNVPKGSRPIDIFLVKADVGSRGGHGDVPAAMLEAVADIWAQEAAAGRILDFAVSRCGDDINILVTHINGKESPYMHDTAWNGFLNATAIARDLGLYGAGQDLLADAPAGNITAAGPGVVEAEFMEREAEQFTVLCADKCGPGVYNEAFRWTFTNPRAQLPALKPGKANDLVHHIIDFNYRGHEGRSATLVPREFSGLEFSQAVSQIAGEQTDYSWVKITTPDGQDVAVVAATRLHDLGDQKYTGKDDPAALVRMQGDFPATGSITAPFAMGIQAAGWMSGSQIGRLMPTSVKNAKIGFYDGPPLVTAVSWNVNNGRLEAPMDLFAANDAIRAVQDDISRDMIRFLSRVDSWGQGTGRAPAVEMAYQPGIDEIDRMMPWRTHEGKPAGVISINKLTEAEIKAKVLLFNGSDALQNPEGFKAIFETLSENQIAVLLAADNNQKSQLASIEGFQSFNNFQVLTIEEAGLQGFNLPDVMLRHGYRIEEILDISFVPLTSTVTETYAQLKALEDKV